MAPTPSNSKVPRKINRAKRDDSAGIQHIYALF